MSGELNFIYKGKRGYREIDLSKSGKDLLEAITAGGELAFEVTAVTKTQLSVEVFNEQITFVANAEIEGFKLAKKESYSYLTSTHQKSILFKLTKTQGKERFEQYLAKVVEHISKQLEINIPQKEFTVHCNGFKF